MPINVRPPQLRERAVFWLAQNPAMMTSVCLQSTHSSRTPTTAPRPQKQRRAATLSRPGQGNEIVLADAL